VWLSGKDPIPSSFIMLEETRYFHVMMNCALQPLLFRAESDDHTIAFFEFVFGQFSLFI